MNSDLRLMFQRHWFLLSAVHLVVAHQKDHRQHQTIAVSHRGEASYVRSSKPEVSASPASSQGDQEPEEPIEKDEDEDDAKDNGSLMMNAEFKALLERLRAHRPADFANILRESYAVFNGQAGECHALRHASTIEDNETCPDRCRYFAEDASTPFPCVFKCVTANECGKAWADTREVEAIPGEDLYCRACEIRGCKECHATLEECIECKTEFGFELNQLGGCDLNTPGVEKTLLKLLLGMSLVGMIWYFSLTCCRKWSNLKEEELALEFRTATKLLQGSVHYYQDLNKELGEIKEAPTERKLLPLSTSLMATPVAGPGSPLYFRFLVFIIFLLTWTYITWIVIATKDLQQLGLDSESEPRLACKASYQGVLAWGEGRKASVNFLIATYVSWFLFIVVFAIWQKRSFNRFSEDCVQMSDFTLLIQGLPAMSGELPCEQILADHIAEATGQKVIGVSIGWDYGAIGDAARILEILEDLEDDLNREQSGLEPTPQAPYEPPFFVFRIIDWLIFDLAFGIPTTPRPDIHYDMEEAKKVATSCRSSEFGFVIFESEEARDKALEVKEISFRFFSKLQLSIPDEEPSGVRWFDFAISRSQIPFRCVKYFLIVLGTVCVQTAWFLPYALWAASIEVAEGGKDPTGFVHQMALILVTFSNFTVFLVCQWAAEKAGFVMQSDVHHFYMIMYIWSTLANFVLDVVCEFVIAYQLAVENNVRNWVGTPIEQLNYYEMVTTYSMSRRLGEKFQEWMFPPLFLLPFLLEPIFLGWLFFHLQRRAVRVFPHLRGRDAQVALSICGAMDTGRYADFVLNISAAMLILFTPGGFYSYVWVACILSLLYMLLADRYRVLRYVPAFTFNRPALDESAQGLLALPLGIIAMACVWETHCYDYALDIIKRDACKEENAWFRMGGGFIAHVIVHKLVLKFVVPLFVKTTGNRGNSTPYSKVASLLAASYFNTNPLHCIRSRFYYKHDPPCDYYTHGKEHLLRRNEQISQFYERRTTTQKENYWWW